MKKRRRRRRKNLEWSWERTYSEVNWAPSLLMPWVAKHSHEM